MGFEIFVILVCIFVIAVIVNTIADYNKHRKSVMSFKESMDLTDLPVITFYNGGNKYNFLLDTGANLSIIDASILSSLYYEELPYVGNVFGMEGIKVEVPYVRILLEYKGKYYEESFQVLDMSTAFGHVKAESGVTISGVLGNKFFKTYKYILDFDSLIAYSKK